MKQGSFRRGREDTPNEHPGNYYNTEKVHALIQNRKLSKYPTHTTISNLRKAGSAQFQRKPKSKTEPVDIDPDALRHERFQVTRQLQYLESKHQAQTFDIRSFLNPNTLADRFILMVRSA